MGKKKNLCGTCRVCCTILRINKKFLSWRDTDKERGELCDKYVNNRCSKYLSRPKPCKTFECLFLKLSKLNIGNPEWRPDKIGCMIKIGLANGKTAVMIEELEQGSLNLNTLTPDQDKFLRVAHDLSKESNCLFLIRPFGYDHQYPLDLI